MFMQNPPPIRLEATLSKAQYQFVLQSPDTDDLYANSAAFESKLRGLPMIQDVTSDCRSRTPGKSGDRPRQGRQPGYYADQIEEALYSAYGTRQVSTIYSPSNQYQVIMELDPQYRLDPSALGMLYVRSNSGQLVPLSSLATLSKGLGPLSVNHLGQITAVTISFNLKPGNSTG